METQTDILQFSKTKNQNKDIAKALYKALVRNNLEIVAQLLATDLEWSYYGPPNCEHMMRMLTGKSRNKDFKFKPRRIEVVGDNLVIVEGLRGPDKYWVHVWTIDKNGKIMQFREYFNTYLTVIIRGVGEENMKVWQSERLNHSLPDLVLAV